ncbi:MAG: hypothetical protein E6K60_10730 [Nitrospirae bacterium]|nr:MAG: hypothetical protein E6K60_10730 [Nitrospirota bacterium]
MAASLLSTVLLSRQAISEKGPNMIQTITQASEVAVIALLGLLVGMTDVGAKSSALPDGVAKAPVCNMQSRPKIVKVTPDSVKPGGKIVIKGENFGTKECFHQVSFGSSGPVAFRYLNETTLEATVPNMKPGLTPVNVLTEGGSSQSIVLVQAK